MSAHTTLLDLFAHSARAHAEEPALSAEDRTVTYRALDSWSDRLAHKLITLGAGPERLVALALPRSVDMVVAQLAVLKAGAAYLPIDPDYPADRIRAMVDDARPLLVVDDPAWVADAGDTAAVPVRPHPDQPAYVIYTSGSTGRPKGVVVTHRGLATFATAEVDRFDVRPGDRVLLFSSPSFDASVLELCMAFAGGAALVVPPPGPLVGEQLADVLAARAVSHALIPPVVLATLPDVELPHLRTLVVGGDACTAGLVRRWAPGRRMVNAYGPTESTVVSTWSDPLTPGEGAPPIGRAIPGTEVLVLDDDLRPAEHGELYVAGVGLARGYLDRPGLTAQRFLAAPDGQRRYRTGDVVRRRAGGDLEFVGRADHQVKIRGFRVEPGEIEAVLAEDPRVGQAVVVPRTDSGLKRLVAYVVPAGDDRPDPADLRAVLAARLPDYLVPAAIVVLDAFPLSPNGKLDRAALPAPVVGSAATGYVAPRDERERVLAGLWADVLGATEVGVEDDFFALGGDSILASRLRSRIIAEFGAELSGRAVFDARTVAALAALLPATSAHCAPISPAPSDRPLPLSPAQRRLWLAEITAGGLANNTGAALRLTGDLDRHALRTALDRLAARHGALRTTIDTIAGQPCQLVAPAPALPLREVRTTDLHADLARDLAEPFDLRTGPTTRATLFALGPREHVLLLAQHHLVTDGWSMALLIDELLACYREATGGAPAVLAGQSVTYGDFAAWAADRADHTESLAYWRERLDGLVPLDLPTDRPRPAVRVGSGGVLRRELPADLVRRLSVLGAAHDATLFMTLTAAVQLVLAARAGTRDVAVGAARAGRPRTELDTVAGFFVNTLVLRSTVDPSAPFSEFLGQVRETALDAFAHDDAPFDRVVDHLAPERDASRTPLVQAVVALQQPLLRATEAGGLLVAEQDLPRPASRFDLTVEFWPRGDALTMTAEYDTALFDLATIEGIAAEVDRVLRAIADQPDSPLETLVDLSDTGRTPRVARPTPARYLAPRTPVEATLAQVYAKVLGAARVGVRDNFFALGGDSILSIQVVAAARAAGVVVTSRDVFTHQTVAALAPHAVAVDLADRPDNAAVSGSAPLTPIQRWFLDTHTVHPQRFHQSCVVDLGEPVDEAALRAAVAAITEHHDALRMRFADTTEQVNAPVGADGAVFGHGPLFTATTIGETTVRLAAHHLVVDGLSWRVLAEDLRTAHARARLGLDVRLPGRTTSFRDWARRLATHTAEGGFDHERAHWAHTVQVDGRVPCATDGSNTVATQREVTVSLTEDETRALVRTVPDAYRTRVDEVLLTALASTLGKWTGRDRLLVDVEGHGREDLFAGVDVSRTVGWFTTVYPVALPVRPDWGNALKAVKETVRSVPRRGIGYGALRHLAGAQDLACAADVSFNYLGRFDGPTGLDLDAHPDAARAHVLDVVGRIEGDRLAFTWYFSENLHRADTIATLADTMLAALRDLTGHCANAHGRTPSDFPLVALDQAAVDRLAVPGVADLLPLTPMQAGMVFHGLSQSGTGAYFQQTSFVLDDVPDPAALAAAWQHVVDRTPILRSSVLWQEEPVLVVHDHVPVPITILDWTGQDRAANLATLLAADQRTGFDLDRAPLMRLTIARLSPTEVQVLWTFHHVLLDGWSVFGVLADVAAAHAGAPLPERPDFAEYPRWIAGQDDGEEHWRPVLAEVTAPTPLPFDRPRSSVAQPTTSARTDVALSVQETTALYDFAKAQGLTPGTVVQGAWALLLAQYSGQRQVCFGATVSGRPADLRDVESIIGMFVNTLPVVATVDGAAAVADWLRELQRGQAGARAAQHTPLTKLHGWSQVPGGVDLFDSAVIFENYPMGGPPVRELAAVESTTFPLSVTVYPTERLSLLVGYEPGLFDADTAQALAEHLVHLLRELTADPDRPVSAVPALSTPEQVDGWNRTDVDVPATTLTALLSDQAAKTPDGEALVFEDVRWTYAELHARADRLANWLRDQGAGPERVVAVALPRSAELIVALLAVLKSGAAYLPIDPNLPRQRIDFMVADAGAVLLLDSTDLPGTDQPATAPELDPANGAYVIYTSGSTGKPKGVVVPHEGIVNRLLWTQDRFRLGPGDRVLQKTPMSFDVSVWEFFWPLMVGATLVVARPDGHRDPAYLAELIRSESVTTVHFVPSMLRAFLRHADLAGCISLRRVLCSGEALPQDLAEDFHAACEAELHNLYGPTEASVDVTHWHCEPGQPTVPIGRPVWNTRLHVLDDELRPVPVGAPGELHLAGVQLARGYLNRPGLTAERFIANPFEPGRLYRTGDLVRWTRDGAVEYLGRTDHQVKIRGFRIEPGEVESALSALPEVDEAAVIARDGRLVAYVVPATADPAAIRAAVAGVLPEHLVPSAVVALERLPLTTSGKLDRRALPDPDFTAVSADTGPETGTEKALAEIWAEVLDLDRVGVEDSFFDLGGDSILSLHVTARANAAFGVALKPRDVLTARTVRALATLVEDQVLRELEELARLDDATE
ncbi:non-ribosomal peptide synthase domain TIGR01720/amino acid adenylation domain-containing protein [Actinokineospora alba]|uniref:Non-ribosomal peptide synthase domain TIGR01720/amino acid adenylation domain-containing protein n=1 Tax=Actinokineospora alba TaxID=504798 RepID=A0A1H0FU61_9PSEU|nr:non-ribosomal peptide synthetase [Actinokineospora alba]TDP69619.1 non-ribosomal peptide synthase protein (TIGR01720 family)/amino acid adenylation domain-containing protein [Actinokineospora alba]SDI12815.1 non-ribosomal peptide synthase domain TIGR01720/amino acid adenylation domain-containing protein [Actinokineospora alba]SDN98175.1 non-ribosomal peptide synthase domain TIGR01720/amino acid adenylation domain-containing protein [Actinokineospora alba]